LVAGNKRPPIPAKIRRGRVAPGVLAGGLCCEEEARTRTRKGEKEGETSQSSTSLTPAGPKVEDERLGHFSPRCTSPLGRGLWAWNATRGGWGGERQEEEEEEEEGVVDGQRYIGIALQKPVPKKHSILKTLERKSNYCSIIARGQPRVVVFWSIIFLLFPDQGNSLTTHPPPPPHPPPPLPTHSFYPPFARPAKQPDLQKGREKKREKGGRGRGRGKECERRVPPCQKTKPQERKEKTMERDGW